jgi:integrase
MIARQNRRPEQRTIPMSPTVVNTLREWKLSCPKSELSLVFPNTAGKVEWLASINYRVWRPLLRKIGLVDQGRRAAVQFSMSHFAASQWIELGFSSKRLQALLGHSSIQTTFDKYGHLFPFPEDEHEKFARSEIGLVA